eukprot:80094_1
MEGTERETTQQIQLQAQQIPPEGQPVQEQIIVVVTQPNAIQSPLQTNMDPGIICCGCCHCQYGLALLIIFGVIFGYYLLITILFDATQDNYGWQHIGQSGYSNANNIPALYSYMETNFGILFGLTLIFLAIFGYNHNRNNNLFSNYWFCKFLKANQIRYCCMVMTIGLVLILFVTIGFTIAGVPFVSLMLCTCLFVICGPMCCCCVFY